MRPLLLAVMVFLAAAAPAAAAPAFLPPQPGFAFGDSNNSAVVMAPDGAVTLARLTPTEGVLATRTRPPGGAFGEPQTVAGPQPAVTSPRLAVRADGAVVATFVQDDDTRGAIKPPGGTFGAPFDVAPGHEAVTDPVLDPSGRLFQVVYDGSSAYALAVREAGGSRVTVPLGNTSGGRTLFFKLAPAPGGARVVVTVAEPKPSCDREFSVRSRDVGPDGLGPEVTLATASSTGFDIGGGSCAPDGGESINVAVTAVSPAGAQLVAFVRSPHGGAASVEARTRAAGAPWADEPVQTISSTLSNPFVTDATYAGETPVVAATASESVALISRGAGGWGTALVPGSAGVFLPAYLGGSPAGTAIAVYRRLGQEEPLFAVVRHADGTLGEAKAVSGPGHTGMGYGRPGLDAEGNGVVAWFRDVDPSATDTWRAEYAGYDAAGPRVSAAGPAAGTVGAPLTFTATAADVWSAIPGPLAWAFGNDGTAAGGTVSHTFATAGARTVTATATDALGNAGSASVAVQVEPAPTPTPPPTPGSDKTAPKVTKVKVEVRKRRATISFRLSERATVRAALKRGKKRAGSVRRRGLEAGKRTLRTKRLKRGKHVATLVATDAAGNRSKAVKVRFRVR